MNKGKEIFIIIILISLFSIESQEFILTNKPSSSKDKRYDYPTKLLELIMEKTESKYGEIEVKSSRIVMTRDRLLVELIKGEEIHVMAEASKPEWVEKLIPIRIPIRKGIQGYRLFFINKSNVNIMENIRTLDDLKKIPTGSGSQWSTTKVLTDNKFNVVLGNNYDGLFMMLMKGERFVSFGRGINEIPTEYDANIADFPNLMVEEDLVLFIPLPTYFFVSPTKPNIAKRIEEGLWIMINDGSFDDYFMDNYGELINKYDLKSRKMFSVNNPNLTSEDPIDNDLFWYKP